MHEEPFADAGNAAAIGEASPIYLECPQAAAQIRVLLPAARIICVLRKPIDSSYSHYLMYPRSRSRWNEPERDLTARSLSGSFRLLLDADRLIPRAALSIFRRLPAKQIHVFLVDDLKRNPKAVVKRISRILDVNPVFDPDFATPHNISASMALERFFTNGAIRAAIEPWMPKRASHWVRQLRTSNLRPAPPLPAKLREDLAHHFRDEVAKTAELVGRDLKKPALV